MKRLTAIFARYGESLPFLANLPEKLRKGGKSGQAMTEYVIVAGMLTAAVAILAVFLYTFKEYGGRVLDLVSSDYP